MNRAIASETLFSYNIDTTESVSIQMIKQKHTKYQKLTEQLREEIRKREPGGDFYTVREIMADFDASQATVTKSLDILSNEGLIEVQPGSGIHITDKAALLKKRKFTICIAIPRWSSLSFQESEVAFYEEADRVGFIPETVYFDWQNTVPQKLPEIKIDAMLIITSSTEERLPEEIEKLNQFGIPYAFIDKKISNCNANCIYCDGHDSGSMAADHLIKNGHRKLAVIVTEPDTTHISDKIRGFVKYASLQGAEVEIIDAKVKSGELAHDKVYTALKAYLKNGKPSFTAAFTVSNEPTIAVYKAIYEAGLKIPDDISIITSGDNKLSGYHYPGLTSVSESLEKTVSYGINMLLEQLSMKHGLHQRKAISVDPELIIRESVKSLK